MLRDMEQTKLRNMEQSMLRDMEQYTQVYAQEGRGATHLR